jgi:hypothetical protein
MIHRSKALRWLWRGQISGDRVILIWLRVVELCWISQRSEFKINWLKISNVTWWLLHCLWVEMCFIWAAVPHMCSTRQHHEFDAFSGWLDLARLAHLNLLKLILQHHGRRLLQCGFVELFQEELRLEILYSVHLVLENCLLRQWGQCGLLTGLGGGCWQGAQVMGGTFLEDDAGNYLLHGSKLGVLWPFKGWGWGYGW